MKQFPSDQIIGALVKALQDINHQIRRRASKLLGELNAQQVIPALINALNDLDAGVRYEAAEALRKLKNPEAIPALIAALNDSNYDVRSVAITALGYFGDTRAVEPLMMMLIEQKDHRLSCIEALRNICGFRNMEPLFELIRNCKKMIADTSSHVLENIYLSDIHPLTDMNGSVRTSATYPTEKIAQVVLE
jgi:vesicle coat complex subunit